MLMSPHAQAQCPVVPLSTIAGTWVFSTDGFSAQAERERLPAPVEVGYLELGASLLLSSGGRFTAAVGADTAGNPLGILTITQTTAISASVTRLEANIGRYQLYADCTAGSLTFNVGSRPVQLDFFLINPTEMFLVGSNNGDIVTGSARLVPTLACPANPLLATDGVWVFSAEGYDLLRIFPGVGMAGRMVANGNVLIVTQTAGVFGGNVRLEVDAGRIFVNGDCSGGSMSFAIGGRTIQFDFFFANPSRMVLAGSTGGNIIIGEARRFGTL
jgi:hypothetical protein